MPSNTGTLAHWEKVAGCCDTGGGGLGGCGGSGGGLGGCGGEGGANWVW